jgi:hypothetical protein
MPQRAQVTSIDALESFRENLIVYISKMRPTVEEVSEDVRRMRDWLEHDCQRHWENEYRRRSRALEDARQALFSSRLSSLQEASTAQQWAVTRARRSLEEAEDKLRRLKKWRRDFNSLTDPLTKELDQLHSFLVTELPRAAAYLAHAVKILESYAAIGPMADSVDPQKPVETEQAHLDPKPEIDQSILPDSEHC